MEFDKRKSLLRDACITKREAHTWLGLSNTPVTQRGANKFILGAIIDYQIKADKAWAKADWFAEVYFNGVNDIWSHINSYSKDEWFAICKSNSVHRFPKAYERIQRIGGVIENIYHGDARCIWSDVPSDKVRDRLLDLGLGNQITNMVLGALFDTSLVSGSLDVKADLHITRVLGRVLLAKEIAPNQAIVIARDVYNENPWLLDSRLFQVGKTFCKRTNPHCYRCFFGAFCLQHEIKERSESTAHS